MYNLLISGAESSWEGDPFELPRNRVFEYTDEGISARFKELNPEQLTLLYEMPTLFAYEMGRNKDARLGNITRVQIRHREIRIEYVFRDDVGPIPMDYLEGQKWALDIEDFYSFMSSILQRRFLLHCSNSFSLRLRSTEVSKSISI